jgi:hypothetical protein
VFGSRFAPPTPVTAPTPKKPTKKPPVETDSPEQKLASQRELARQRAALGFDDIPIASASEVRQETEKRERVGKWAKKTYKKQFSAEKRRQVVKFFKNKEYLKWKEDLEWAMKADRDDTEVQQSSETSPKLTPRPADQRRIRVPERDSKSTSQAITHAQTVAPVPAATDSHKTIDININFGALPKLPKPTKLSPAALLARIKSIRWNRRTQIASGIVVLTVIVAAAYIITNAQNHPKTTSTTIAQKPTYQTIVPSNKPSSSLTWQRVSPPGSDPVFAYADTIDGVSIFVSQQPIPDSFQPNVDDKVAQLAASYTATDKISAGSTPVYVGTSAQGPQSVIFSKNNLLVLIKSASKISDDAWTSYANSLQ